MKKISGFLCIILVFVVLILLFNTFAGPKIGKAPAFSIKIQCVSEDNICDKKTIKLTKEEIKMIYPYIKEIKNKDNYKINECCDIHPYVFYKLIINYHDVINVSKDEVYYSDNSEIIYYDSEIYEVIEKIIKDR